MFDIRGPVGMNLKGRMVSFTIDAQNQFGSSPPSAPFPFTVPGPERGPKEEAAAVMELCDQKYADDAAQFGMDADPTEACSFQDAYVEEIVTAMSTGMATQVSLPLALIFLLFLIQTVTF